MGYKYSHGSNISLINYFSDKDIANSVEELKKIYIKNLLKMISFKLPANS